MTGGLVRDEGDWRELCWAVLLYIIPNPLAEVLLHRIRLLDHFTHSAALSLR